MTDVIMLEETPFRSLCLNETLEKGGEVVGIECRGARGEGCS